VIGPYELVLHGAGKARHASLPPRGDEPANIKRATKLLIETRYAVPPQDLTIEPSGIPAIPEVRFLLAFA